MLLKSKQYLTHSESATYASWESIPDRDNVHVLAKEGEPAILVVIGQVIADRLAVRPLGSYQNQKDKEYKTGYHIDCKDVRITFSLQRPSSYPEWVEDYNIALSKIEDLQEKLPTGRRLGCGF